MTKPDLKTIKYRDQEWAMVHDGWPTGKPGVDAGADRHELLEYIELLEKAFAYYHANDLPHPGCPVCDLIVR
jgi:hypothetical protein